MWVYDPASDVLAAGRRSAKAGVPIASIDDMHALFDAHPARSHEHVDDDQQRTRDVRCSRSTSRSQRERGIADARGHVIGTTPGTADRQRVSRARHVHLPARVPEPRSRRVRRDEVTLRARAARVEPGERVQLSPAGGRGDAGAGARVRARQRGRRARSRARARPRRCRGVPASRCVGRAGLSGRQRRPAVRRGNLQDARVHAAVGRAVPRALRRHRSEAAPVSLRRAGELALAHRAAAGGQRVADRDRGARRHASRRTRDVARCNCRRGTRRSACRARGISSGRCGCSRCRVRDRLALLEYGTTCSRAIR